MVRKQIKCGRCNRIFWSPVKKAYILVAKKKKKNKQEVRIVKGAFMKRKKAEEQKVILTKELCPKEFDKIDIEPQLTVQKFLCQRCQNTMSMLQTRPKHQEAEAKRFAKNRPIREIPKEEVNRIIDYQIQQKIVQDYRKKMKEDATEKRRLAIIQKQKELKKLQAEKVKLFLKKRALEKKDEENKPVGKDKPKTA